MDGRLPRKLAAILYADVAGYTRLTGEDEDGTHRQLSACLDTFSVTIRGHDGRVVHVAGDAILAEFPSVSQALTCAVTVQQGLAKDNSDLPEGRRLRFRIGVNLGEVIVDRNDIYGDGVNVAARLQTLAQPGGICVSESVRNAIGNGLPLEYEPLREQDIEDVSKPVHAWRVSPRPGATLPAPSRPEALSSRHSIAVLPFENLSDDPGQEYFADGLTDDIITDLAKIPGLFVIARNSSFTYKGKPADVQQVGGELGVEYVLEGSVRRAGQQVRINAQLVHAATGGHLWAERYDEQMDNLLAVQDRVTGDIASTLAIEFAVEPGRRQADGTDNIEAYDACLQGWALANRETPEDFAKAICCFEHALELDPDYGRACAALAWTYINGSERGLSLTLGLPWHVLRARARKYLKLAMGRPTVPACLAASFMSLKQRLWSEAVAHAEDAIALEPSNAGAHGMLAYASNYAGQPERAIEAANHAMRLDPVNPSLPLQWIGRAQFALGNFEESLRWLERAAKHNPTVLPAALIQASANANLGRRKQAEAALAQYLAAWKDAPTVKQIMYFWPFRDAEVAHWFVQGILDAGLEDPDGDYYQVSEHDQLESRQISDLLEDRSVGGSDPWTGNTWTREYRDGAVRWKGHACDSPTWHGPDVEADCGRFTIRDGLIHEQWNRMHEGTEMCFPVFRNPSGTRARGDEHLFMTDTGILAWSRTG